MVVGFYRYSARWRGFVTIFLKKICKILENRRKQLRKGGRMDEVSKGASYGVRSAGTRRDDGAFEEV
jgi:hypothetical protein